TFEATITYFIAAAPFMFIQDEGVGIFVVDIPAGVALSRGDRVLVKGTVNPGFRPYVKCGALTLLRHGSLPIPLPAQFDELIRLQRDCLSVRVRGVVETVVPQPDAKRATYMQLFTGGGYVDVLVDGESTAESNQLRGAEVEVTGVAAARLDTRWNLNGVQLLVAAPDDIKILRWAAPTAADGAYISTTLPAIHALSLDEVIGNLPVVFEATVTYLNVAASMMIVEAGGAGIYVKVSTGTQLTIGDRVLVRGKMAPGIRPSVNSDSLTLLGHGSLPNPVPASFDELIHVQRDCLRVTVHAVVRSADKAWGAHGPTFLRLVTDKGIIDAFLDSNDARAREDLLDAEADITGVATAKLDGKGQEAGVLLFVTSLADIQILHRAKTALQSLPMTATNEVIPVIQVADRTPRVRVSGTITYHEPGAGAVLQSKDGSLWIMSRSLEPLRIGDRADATGYPTLHDGFRTLSDGNIQDNLVQEPVSPANVTWKDLASSHYNFDLVSTEGQVVAEIREASQDEYVMVSGNNLFTAIYRHPDKETDLPLPALKIVPPGSRVRITCICMLKDADPFKGPGPFDILLRSFDDIAVVANPSPLNIRNLMLMVGLLLVAVFAVIGRGWALERKVRRQTATLAEIERQRSRILEDINGERSLAEILEEIAAMVSATLEGAPCWCEVADGERLGTCLKEPHGLRIVQAEIPGRCGPALGTVFAGFDPRTSPLDREAEALQNGARLATLAIETRRFYSDLRRRSEFDQLTDIPNRFAMEKLIELRIEEARESGGIIGLIYIDLDKFKPINDTYGHHVGDLYLQAVALRMSRQLLSGDMLARLGGDEFAALVSLHHGRADLEKIAARLEHCFDEPFGVEGIILQGEASIGVALYPEDGATKDSLLSAADAAMYLVKHAKRQIVENAALDPALTA
ncbi:MAG: GGDEF domain-containing protein, partial [Terracidiphilus sp.]